MGLLSAESWFSATVAAVGSGVYKRPFLELQREAPCSRAGLTAARFPEDVPDARRFRSAAQDHSRLHRRRAVKIALQEWLRRIPDFSLKPGAEIICRPGGVVGPETLPRVGGAANADISYSL